MGWTGGGIGRHSDGRLEPVPAVPPNARCLGPRGHGQARSSAPRPRGAPPANAPSGAKRPQDKLRAADTADGDVVYGYPNAWGWEEVELTVKGLPRRTGRQSVPDPGDLRKVVRWGGSVMGIAENTFPHPTEWRIRGVDAPLHKVTVRALTRAISMPLQVLPSCLAAWEARLEMKLPSNVGDRYNNRLLNPKYWVSHFKNVLHRGMHVRGTATAVAERGCRVCSHPLENLMHFAVCDVAGKVFEQLAPLAIENNMPATLLQKQRFALFAIAPSFLPIDEGWINFHLLLWKFVIYQLTIVSTEDAVFTTYGVWQAAWHAFKRKALAKSENVRTEFLRAESRGLPPPDLSKRGRCMEPLASFDDVGTLIWNDSLVEKMEALCERPTT